MRFSVVAAIVAFGSTAIAQNLLGSIPQCAQNCFGSNLGDCGTFDIACICSSEVIGSVSCCVFDTCNEAEVNSTITFATGICGAEGVDLNTSPDCPNNSASSSVASSSAASGSQSSTASVTGISGSASPTVSGSTTSTTSDATASDAAASETAASDTAATGAGPLQTAGAGAMGLAMAGLLAFL